MSGLPFRVPTARDIVRDVRECAAVCPTTSIGRCYNSSLCIVANWIAPTAGGRAEVVVRPYRHYFAGCLWEPTITVRELIDLDRDHDTVTTVYMQPDLAALARLFDHVVGRGERVYPEAFLARIAAAMPWLLEDR